MAERVIYATPVIQGFEEQVQVDNECWYEQKEDGNFVFHDPLLDVEVTIGDRSVFPKYAVDETAKTMFEELAFHSSTRQLSDIERWQIKLRAGRWSRLGHMISCGLLAQRFGGNVEEVAHYLLHDLSHMSGSHRRERLFAEHAKSESFHDGQLTDIIRRFRFVDALHKKGVIDINDDMMDHPFALDEILDEAVLATSFANRSAKPYGDTEVERLQYGMEEQAIWVFPREHVRQMMQHVERYSNTPVGDTLVFDSVDAGRDHAIGYTRLHTENWSEPVHQMMQETQRMLDKVVLALKSPNDEHYTAYLPQHTFYMLEEDWVAHIDSLAEEVPSIRILVTILDKIAEHQQRVHGEYDFTNIYSGPETPDWLTLTPKLIHDGSTGRQVRNLSGERTLSFDYHLNKPRKINPFIKERGNGFKRIEEICPDVSDWHDQQSQWQGTAYNAAINLEKLGFNKTEVQQLERLLASTKERWPEVLSRPEMPPEEMSKRIQVYGERAKRLGKITINNDQIVLPTGLILARAA